jgi:hypothetical protein
MATQVTPMYNELPTYRASLNAFTPVAGVTFSLKGSATKTVKIRRIGFSATAATGAVCDVKIDKLSGLTGGTAATVTGFALDSASSAYSAVAQSWSGTVATPTSVGTIENTRYEIVTAAVSVNPQKVVTVFGDTNGTQCPTLRGTSEWIAILFSAVGTTPLSDLWIEWTEE